MGVDWWGSQDGVGWLVGDRICLAVADPCDRALSVPGCHASGRFQLFTFFHTSKRALGALRTKDGPN